MVFMLAAVLAGTVPHSTWAWEGPEGEVYARSRSATPRHVVVYIHGYYDDVGTAMARHDPLEKLLDGAPQSLVVAIEAPSGPKQAVRWPSARALRQVLETHLGAVPDDWLLVAHSGGFRTVRAWVQADSQWLKHVVLLDGFYGATQPWSAWLAASPSASLRLVGVHTYAKSRQWLLSLPAALQRQVQLNRAATTHRGLVEEASWLADAARQVPSL
jgi:pimeloyl-ACP methyl ester carboxylesterase